MDFRNFNFPCTIDINVVKAYMTLDLPMASQSNAYRQRIRAFDINWDAHQPRTLRVLASDKIVENWAEIPIFQEIPQQADRDYILTNLDLSVPLRTSSAHIKDDYFWRKSYHHRWKVLPPDMEVRPWINVYMERHLQEYLERLEVCDYDQESVQTVLDVCAPYINKLNIEMLQPSMGERSDHIPLNYVLSNLPDLKYFRVTYCTKTIGTNFYLGCSSFSRNDIVSFARGLSRSYELTEFWIHSVKLEPIQLALIARALDKACQHLTKLSITHCAMHDDGLQHFLDSCTRESFTGLTSLDLTNNYLSAEGAFLLGQALRGRPLERLILRLNPIQSDGAAALFSAARHLPLKELDLSGCAMTATITKLLMQLIVQNETVLSLDVSNNDFGVEFGQKVYKVIGFNKVLRRLDLRNTGVTIEVKNKINDVLGANQ